MCEYDKTSINFCEKIAKQYQLHAPTVALNNTKWQPPEP